MTVTPDISVVMSVYNGAHQLQETMESVLQQDGIALEFIVVDDGSTDSSGEMLKAYARGDERVRLLTQGNQGLTKALISGCARARGAYIARQDVGDVSRPGRLSTQKAVLDADANLTFVSSWTEYCGPEWEFLYLIKGTGRTREPAFILSDKERHGVIDGPTHHGSVMCRRSDYLKVGGYRAEFYYGQDWDLWYRLAQVGKFQTIGQALYRSRLTPGSISASNKSQQAAIGELSLMALARRQLGLSEAEVLRKASEIRPLDRRNESAKSQAMWLYFIGECLRRNNDERSKMYFREAIRRFPLSLAPWARLLQMALSPK